MATKNLDKASTEEKTFKATAKQFIKYGGEHLKAGDKFQVKESDVKELNQYAEIEILEEKENQNPDGEGGQQGGNGGE
ncbi:hypothetical protein psyc5s11_30110 [Clostridium gelidum]|uniref:DUF7210 domain-containing protein n=1 Tax=Clostridium gelidum TaxID=704125 RepID=A0ABM7T4N7_9CLOT|nr:hypothetical protein [Clostridium gelidum]BCZ46944.1 hypothetical protein psyc5s11_30110 [Clostridium gelidum]